MKRLLVLMLVLGFAYGTANADLVSHWAFDEGSGNIAYDSANGNHGTIYGATWTTGIINGALNFDGANDYVEVPDDTSLDLTTFTLEAVFKIDYLPANGQTFMILGKGEDSGTDHGNYYVMVMKDNYWGTGMVKIGCGFEDYTDINYWLVYDIDESYVGRFVHFVCTLEGNDWNMFIDGVKVSTEMYKANSSIPGLSGQVPVTGNSPLYIGSYYDPSVPGLVNFFPGVIDEVRIYNHAIPEPASLLLLGLGAIFLRRNR